MTEYWDVYFGYIEEKMASVVLDMEISEEIDTEQYRHAIAVRLTVKEPNEDGFPMDLEADKMAEMEDKLSDYVLHKNMVQVGRVTTDGVRELIFYSKQEDPKDLIEAAERFIQLNGYDFEVFNIEEDENWAFYFDFLYPNIYQQQHMGNRAVIESLEEAGDALDVPRKVEHWLFFEKPNLLKRFVKAIKKEGFTVEEESSKTNEEGRYSLVISRIDQVDFVSINEVTDLLVDLSEQFEGIYDGWETVVINQK